MEEKIIPGYEQYKKYITKAQKAKLVEGQQRFNNQLADERVNAMGQMRSDINQQRAYLQNRGLAGNGAPFHSGAEAYGVQQNQAAFRGYNQQLQGVQDAQTEQLAAKFASDTRRARARASAQQQFTEYLDKLTDADRDEMMNGTGDEAKAFQAQVKKALGKKGMDTLRGQTYTSRTSAENEMNYMGGLSQKELASLDTDPAMAGIRQEIIDSVGMENYELMKGYYAKPKQTSVSSMGQGLSFDAKSAISRLSSMGTTGGNQGRMEQDIATRMNATLDAFNGNPALSMPVQQLGMVTVADRADRAAAIQPTYNLDAYRGEWLDQNYNYTQNEARIQELNGNLENAGKFVENAQRLVDHYTGLSKTRQLTMDEWEQMEQASYYVKNSSKIAEELGKEIAALERKQAKAEEAWGDVRTFFTDTMPRYGQYDLGDMEEIIAQRKAAGDTAGADEASRVLAQKLQDYTASWTQEAKDGGNTTAGHAYHGEPEDYTFENNTGSHYYNVVNDNKVLLWWNEQANRALLKQTQDAVSTIGGMSDGAVLFETLFGSIKGVAQGKGAAAGIAEMTDTAWTEEEFKAWQHMNDQDVFLAEYAEGMTKEQVDTFNYVYNAYGPAEADRYFESIFAQLDARVADNVSESAREIVEGHAILGTLVATPLKFTLSAVSPLTNARASMLTPEGYGGSKGQAAKNNYASLITSGVMQNMHMNAEERFYYGVATSMLDSWFAAGLSGNAFGGGPGANVGGTMLGMSAFNSSYQEAVNRGLAPAQAYTTAVVAGAIEMLTEKYSIEALLNTHEAKLFSPEFFANIAKQSISEGSEETASSICNNIADVIINGDKAELVQQYHQLVDSGDYDEKGALGKVIWDSVKETGMETLAGMMSGALSGGSATVMQNFSTWMHGGKTTAQYAREGEAIRTDAEQMKKLAAHEFTSEIGQDLMESAESVEKASDAELARLNEVMQMEEAASEAVSGVKAQEGAMEALRAYEYRSPEAQVVAQKETYSDSDIAYLAQERLNQEMQDAAQALSSNQEDMKTYPVFTKIANGQAITMEEAQQIADNDAAMAFFAQKYGAANGADGVLQNATMASRKVQQTYGTLKDAQVSGTTARKAEKIFRDASTIAEDTKTQDFKTRRGSVQVALRSGDTRYFSSQQKAAIGLCIAAANATGANIVVRDTFRTSENQRLKDTPRGRYDRDTNTIEIALDSDQSVAYVLGHELVHYMEHYAGEGYAAFRDIVFDALDKVDVSKLDADLQRTIQAAREQNPEMSISEAMVAYENKRQGGNLSKPKAEGEVLAEAGSAMLLQKSVQKEIARLNNVTVAERIVEFAHKMGEEIKKLLGEKDFTGEEYNMLKGQADTMRKMEAAYRAMLMEANLNAKKQMEKEQAPAQANTETVQFSLRDDQIKNIQKLPAIGAAALNEKELDALKDLQQYWENLGEKSPYYRAVNGEWRLHDDTPITVATKQDAARGLQKNNDTGWNINVSSKVFGESGHNSASTRNARPYLQYINDIVRNAVLVDTVPMGGRTKSINSLVMHEMYAIADNGNGKDVLKLVVEEMYEPSSESTNKRAYKLTNIEKQPASVRGSQNTSANRITLPTAIHTVADLFKYVNDYKYLENLNKRNRTADDDRYIRHLVDQAAEEAMKNSKVRDENGKLLVVYHGTDKDFTVFDPKKTRNTGDVQGMFFSPYEVDASGYGDAKAFYLNIVRPAKDTAAYALMNSAKSKGLDNPGEYARTMLQRRGNDGVFNGYDEYIAFHPEQIKSADLVTRDDNGNIIPLSQRFNQENPDVRYSVRDEKNGEPYRNDAVADGGTFVQEYTDNAPEVHVPETWVSEYTDNKPTVYHDETRVYFSDGDGTRAAMEQNVEKNMREVTEEIIEPFAELKREDWHGIIAQTRNANFLKQMPVERVLDAICGKNADLRQKMYELVEKPFNEAGGKFARSREAMFQKYTKAMDDLGIKTREQSAAIQRIGEHSYQHKCTVQAWETGNSQYHVRVVDPEQMDVKKQTVTDGQRTFAIEDGRIPIAFRVSDGEGNMVDVAFTLHTENGKQTITLHHNVHGETELFTAGQEGVKEYDMTFRDVMASFQGYGKTIASKAAKYGMAKNSPHVMTDSAYAPYTLEMLQKDHPDDWQNIVEAEKVSRRMYDEYVDSINHMLETVYPMVYEKDEQTIEQLQAKVDEAREDSANQRELITRIKVAIEQGQATIAMMDNTTQEYADAQHSLAVVEQRLKDATKKLAKLTKKAELREAKLTEYKAMVANGDTLRNKRLQKRSDYYHHFQELTDNVVVNLRNILKTNTDIDPQLVNISGQTKPKSKWTEFLQQRVGGAYTEDAVNGMYKYIAGAEYILAYDPLISRFREIQKQYDKATREMKGSSDTIMNSKNANNFMRWMNAWVNNIAGKTHDIDRVISDEIGDRRGLKFIQKLNGLGKSAKLLFNVRSALVQVSNMTNAAMYVDAVDWKNGWFNCLNAMKGKEMAEILAKSNFVSQRLAEVPVFEEATLKSKAMNFANWMLSAGDSFSTQMTWWAAYNQYERIGAEAADAKGYRHYEDAIDYADDITRRTHGGRGVGELPVTLQSRLVNLFAPFQVEVLNTFENLVQVIGKKDALGIAKMQCSIFAFNMVTRCIFGDGVLGFDFIHALMSILKDVFFPEDKEEKLQDHLKYAGQQPLGELISGVPFAAQSATFLVPDETARENMFGDSDPTRYGTGTIGLSFIAEMVNVYNDLVNGKDVSWDLLDATVGNYMTGGSQIMRTAKGLYTWVSGYSTDKKGNVQFAIDQDATELVLMAIFGKWAVPEAREYLGSLDPIADAGYKRTAPNGKKPGMTSDNQNAGYKEFVKAGGNGKDFIKMVKQCSMAEGQKDANGKTISGSVKQAKLDIINGYGLSASLKNIVLQALNIKE